VVNTTQTTVVSKENILFSWVSRSFYYRNFGEPIFHLWVITWKAVLSKQEPPASSPLAPLLWKLLRWLKLIVQCFRSVVIAKRTVCASAFRLRTLRSKACSNAFRTWRRRTRRNRWKWTICVRRTGRWSSDWDCSLAELQEWLRRVWTCCNTGSVRLLSERTTCDRFSVFFFFSLPCSVRYCRLLSVKFFVPPANWTEESLIQIGPDSLSTFCSRIHARATFLLMVLGLVWEIYYGVEADRLVSLPDKTHSFVVCRFAVAKNALLPPRQWRLPEADFEKPLKPAK